MAKGKKKDNAATGRNKTDRDQALIEEGAAPGTAKAEYDEEDYEDDNSMPGTGRDKESNKSSQNGIVNNKEVQEAAREAGDEPSNKKGKDSNASRNATRKSQSAASARVARKEPSKASARGGKNRANGETRSRMQSNKKATSGRGATRAKSTKASPKKQKAKTRTGR
jgi:hypothetical protein